MTGSGEEWGFLVRFQDPEGEEHLMPLQRTADGLGQAARKKLLDRGVHLGFRNMGLLGRYVQ